MKFDINKTNMVKAVAIILMLWHHLFGCATMFCEQYGTEAVLIDYNYIYQFGLLAKICVGIYVFLTAYGITCSYNKKFANEQALTKIKMEQFCFNRYIALALNFIFVYIVAFMTSFLRDGGLSAVYAQEGWKKGIRYVLFDMLGVANYFSTPSLNETWWYMPLALFLVFIIPMMVKLYKQFGGGLVIVGIFLFYFGFSKTSFIQYMMCVIVGIWCAEEHILERLADIKISNSKIITWSIKMLFWNAMFIVLLYLRRETQLTYWIDAIVPIVCCEICVELSRLPMIEKIMAFIGTHSMNMFLIHTLIFEYYFTEFIYGFKNWFLILLMLLLTSLIGSIAIEYLKKLVRYPQLIKWVCNKVDGVMHPVI